MPYADNQGVRIRYQVEGNGRPILLQHGSAGSLTRWYMHGYVDALKADYQLILVDARGHGESDKPYDPAAYPLSARVADVVAVLDNLALEQVCYWGYSMGGWIGFGMAKYAPERINALIIGGSDPYERRVSTSTPLDASDPDKFVSEFIKQLGINPDTLPPEVREQLLANNFRALAAARQDRSSTEDVLPTISVPCLLYAGEADRIFPKTKACAEHISNATFVSLPDCDHSKGLYQADLILPHIKQFLLTTATDC